MSIVRSLPYGRQSIDQDDIDRVVAALRSDFLTTGPLVAEFEAALAACCRVAHACAVNSGTAALHTAYFAAGLRAGDELITSPLTFAATANAALYLGATVRFVDVQPDTGNLDPALLEQAISERTKLIVPVDFSGHPADYDEICATAARHGVRVVADAAHSLGASYRGRPVGSLADLTATSFHPVKPVTTGEGGAVLSDDPEAASRAALFRSHGITRDSGSLEQELGPWHYEMQELGFNYRITDIQCALGLGQLTKLGAFIARRREIAGRYREALSGIESLVLPGERPFVRSGWHLYVIRVAGDPALRRPFFDELRRLGLGVQVHYIPVHLHPYYRRLGFRTGEYPVAEEFYSRSVSLPLYPGMSDEDVDSSIERVAAAVQRVLGR